MRSLCLTVILSTAILGQSSTPQLPADDAVRIREFYRLSSYLQDKVWPGWGQTASPLLLVTPETEFLTHYPSPPKGFEGIGDGFYVRPRQFSTNLLATFPAFGPPSVIVIGQPKNTASKSSTPWLITVMHEHFHQLQNAQPGYFQAVQELNLSGGDKTGMWMLNYPFPYDKVEVDLAFANLRNLLLDAVKEPDQRRFEGIAQEYLKARKKFFLDLSPADGKYFSFQLWQEGIARYAQIKVAEAAVEYQPTADYSALKDFEPFATYSETERTNTLKELKQADLKQWKRTVVYSFGASEGLLLDRLKPEWKAGYFKHPLSMDWFFED